MSRKKIIVFILFAFICTSNLLWAQTASKHFQYTFGGGKKDLLYSTIETEDKGFLSIGYTESFGAGNFDMYVVKNNSEGKLEWTKTYGGTKEDYGRSVVKSQDGQGYLLLGYSNSYSENSYFDIYLIKINLQGDTLWSKYYGLDRSEYGYSVIATKDGGYMILGEVINNINGEKNADVMLIKINGSGDFEWSKIYGGNLTDYLYTIEQLADGSYLMGGETNSFGSGEWDFLAVKIDATGKLLLAKTFGALLTDYGRFATSTPDGGFLVGGNSYNFGVGDMDFVLVKTDKDGKIEWSQSYGEEGAEYMLDIKKIPNDGGYVISGYTNSFGSRVEDVFLINLRNDGKIAWSKTIGGEFGDYGVSVLPTSDNGIVVTGNTKSFDVKSDDCFIFKVEGRLSRNLCNSMIIRPITQSFLKMQTTDARLYELETHIVDRNVPTIVKTVESTEQQLCQDDK
ncbi:MAG: lipoprotein [Chitinophagaceae bacterium]|nr:lipoprotein [Chitinophagaceae bacterium]